ncbi:MAG: hypothetical protein HQK54_15725 [Oligoflexales bacterium]|nr:hypothetical protein [Oligoflexales bacterium]
MLKIMSSTITLVSFSLMSSCGLNKEPATRLSSAETGQQAAGSNDELKEYHTISKPSESPKTQSSPVKSLSAAYTKKGETMAGVCILKYNGKAVSCNELFIQGVSCNDLIKGNKDPLFSAESASECPSQNVYKGCLNYGTRGYLLNGNWYYKDYPAADESLKSCEGTVVDVASGSSKDSGHKVNVNADGTTAKNIAACKSYNGDGWGCSFTGRKTIWNQNWECTNSCLVLIKNP